MKPARITICITLALASGTVMAEPNLPTIEVIGENSTDAQTLSGMHLGEDYLTHLRSSTNDTAKLLQGIPGLNVNGAGGVSSLPVIHGLADDRLRIRVDGMDLVSACGNHMNPPLSYIDPANVESINVFAGIAPVSMGGDSIGGTIQVDSPDPEFAAPGEGLLTKGRAGLFYRSNGDANGGNLSATLASENLSLSYTGTYAEADNYDAAKSFKAAGAAAADKPNHHLSGDEVGSTYYESTNHALGLAWHNANHLLELKLGWQDIPEQGWRNQRMDMTQNDSRHANLHYEGHYGWGTLDARVYEERTRHSMNFGDDKQFWYGMMLDIPGMPMETEGKNRGVRIAGDIALSDRDLLRLGAEAQHYRLDDWWPPSGGMMMAPDTFWNINDGERDRLAGFVEWEARWNPQWLTLLGVRGEKVDMDTDTVQGYNMMYSADAAAFNASDRSETDHNLDLTALARYTLDEMRTLEFGYARKTRSPNLYERYTWSTNGMAMRMINLAGDGNGYVGNVELDPEVAHTVSATFDWHDPTKKDWGLKITPYLTYIDDYIDAERCFTGAGSCSAANLSETSNFVYLQYVNQDARLYGIDVSGFMPLAKTDGYGSFTASGMLSYVRGKNRDTHDDLYNIMPLNATFAVGQKWGNFTNSLEWQLVDGKDEVNDTRNELETGGYGLLNLRSSYQWKQLQVDVGIENVLDKFYEHPLGGAYTGQGQTMSSSGVDWGTNVPGPGRSFYAGLTVEF